jgi:cytochrome c-type biogenesis protein CcmE
MADSSKPKSTLRRVLPGVATLAAILGGIVFLFMSSAGEAFEYYKHVDEVLSEPGKWENKRIQVHGFVVPDSIMKRMDKSKAQLEYKFRAINCGKELEVRYAGIVPDTFKDRAEVVVKGQLKDGYFAATEISAKCPSKYQQAVDGPAMTMCTRGDKNVEGAAPAPTTAAN